MWHCCTIEHGGKQHASLHLVASDCDLAAFARSGLEVAEVGFEDFSAQLQFTNHTLKRALTDADILAGIGNAYSDEILHHARLSPFKQTQALGEAEMHRLHEAAQEILNEWTRRLRAETGDGWPEKVTAFRPEMAVHGRYQQP